MSSISVGELKMYLDSYPDDYEVIMNIYHKYDISKESGLKGWISQINGIHVDNEHREVRLMN